MPLGFWNTSTYILADSETTVTTCTGILRAIYSGEESYVEPIRVHLFNRKSGAAECIKQFQHIPLPPPAVAEGTTMVSGEHWHPFGTMYETFSTPLNTEELSLATSLPRRDVPGLRFVRNAVRFATNPPRLKEGSDVATLGRVMDTGVALDMTYTFDFNSLVRHALVTGVSGSGKSTTCRILIEKVISRKIPVLIIEPAKDEYVRWAINYNQQTDEENQIQIFMPGVEEFEGVPLRALQLNPFEPASAGGSTLDFATRCERFCALLTASLPMADILPTLLEESIYQYLENNLGGDFVERELPARQSYPKLEGLTEVARQIIKSRSYEPKIQDTLIAALQKAVVATMFSDMLSEIRAYGQGLLIVDQLPSRLIPDAIKNTNYKIAHRLVARDDRAAMSACMALRPDQEDIIAVLPIGEAIVCSDHDDAASWVKVNR